MRPHQPLVEPLESRLLLSASPSHAAVAGTFAGSLSITGLGLGGVNDAILVITRETRSGALRGSADIANVGSFNFSGKVGQRKIKLNLNNGTASLNGVLAKNGQLITGTFTRASTKGKLSLSRQSVRGQAIQRTSNGLILTNPLPIPTSHPANNPPGLNNGLFATDGNAEFNTSGSSLFNTGASIFGPPVSIGLQSTVFS